MDIVERVLWDSSYDTRQEAADEIERLREELRVSRQSTTILIKSLDEEIERLHQQKTELIKALEFYANPYGEAECVPDFYSELDFGELAQDAIAKATGGE